MSIRTPINEGLLQSDLDCNGFDLLNFDGGGGTAHGIPAGGTAGQSLTKIDGTDYNAHWSTVTGGSGSIGTVLGNRVSVRDAPYNAIGDGVTDDTVAIQTAINDVCTAGGGTVFFPKGIYLCNGAFDSSTKSILKIPFINNATTSAITLRLEGEEMPAWGVVAPTTNYQYFSTILTTRTDGMTADSSGFAAIIAGNYPFGNARHPTYSDMNGVMVRITGMQFLCPDNPTMGGIRLDGVGNAFVENTNVQIGGVTAAANPSEPTHGTTGVWMPNTINWSISWLKHVNSGGFDTGFKLGEHTRAPWIQAWACKNGVSFLEGMYPSWAKIQLGNCVEGIRFVGQHTVDLLVETEHSPAADWTSAAHDIKDPSNYGSGVIQCYVGSGFPPASTYPSIDGGSQLQIIDMFRRSIVLPASGTFYGNVTTNSLYLGTDARFTPVSGGVKLEARNTGTGTWVEAARWTNP